MTVTKYNKCLLFILIMTLGICLSPEPYAAESLSLDGNCYITILDRTVRVANEGGWNMGVLPTSMGRLQARASCIRDGITTSGQSDIFTIRSKFTSHPGKFYTKKENSIVRILFNQESPIILNRPGQNIELSNTILYASGATRSYSGRDNEPGVHYSSSDLAVATVGINGVLTVIDNGTAIITAQAGTIMAYLIVHVVTPDDSDKDGLPDSYEQYNGLDSNNKNDAQQDQDRDYLTALEEYKYGTNPWQADSDGDGIVDGEEVIVGRDNYITSPVSSDTDNDGLLDGLEIRNGSDPTNKDSVNYSKALIAINVTPKDTVLHYNTIDTESSLKIKVTGLLVDGSKIDLTSKERGTRYTSSDLTIINFGIDDGRVYAGKAGVATVRIDSNGFTFKVRIKVIKFAPTAISSVELPGGVVKVKTFNGYAFLAAGNEGLYVVNYKNSASPYLAASLPLPGIVKDLHVDTNGHYAYIINQVGMIIVDISSPAKPMVVGSVNTIGTSRHITVRGDIAYLADSDNGLLVIDISNKTKPAIIGIIEAASLGGDVIAVSSDNNKLVVATEFGLTTMNISDPFEPKIHGSLSMVDIRDLVVKEDMIYISGRGAHFKTVNIMNPEKPIIISSIDHLVPVDTALSKNWAFLVGGQRISLVAKINIDRPDAAKMNGFIKWPQLGRWGCEGIAVGSFNGDYIFCASNGSDEGRLIIIQYRKMVDVSGIAPKILIVEPQSERPLKNGKHYKFAAIASDDRMVAAVDFIIDGKVVHTDTTVPYEYMHLVADDSSSISLTARASDLAENQTISAPVIFLVTPAIKTEMFLSAGRLNESVEIFSDNNHQPLTEPANYLKYKNSDDYYEAFDQPFYIAIIKDSRTIIILAITGAIVILLPILLRKRKKQFTKSKTP